jgi:hypothetical protein
MKFIDRMKGRFDPSQRQGDGVPVMRRSPTLASNSPGGARIPRGGVHKRASSALSHGEYAGVLASASP